MRVGRRALVFALAATLVAAGRLANAQPAAAAAGAQVSYRLDLRTELATSASNLLDVGEGKRTRAVETEMAARIRGALTFTVVEAGAERRIVAFRLDGADVAVTSGGVADAERTAAVRGALERISVAALEPRNRIAWVWIDRAADPVTSGFVRSVLAATQVVLPAAGPGAERTWDAEEEDPTGRYVARYERTGPASASALAFRKKKVRYLADDAAGAQVVAPVVRASGGLAGRLDPRDGALLSLHGDESQRILVNGRAVGRVRQRLALERVSSGPSDPDAVRRATAAAEALRRAGVATPLYAPPPEEEREAALHRNQLGDATADDLLARLEAADAAGADARRSARTDLFLKLRSLAYLHPEACPRLSAVLSAARPGSLAFEILPLALREAGSDAAQAALVDVLRRRASDREVANAVVLALAGVRRVTPAAQAALSDVAFRGGDRDLAMRAELALGAQAHALARAAPDRADALVRELLSALGAAGDPDRTIVLLLALGNAGSPLALPALRARASDASPDTRGAALSALRFLDAPEADALLVRALESDEDDAVRIRVASAFGARRLTPAAYRAHRAVLEGRAPDALRAAVLQNLWHARDEFPEARKLVSAARRDRAGAVRDEAKRLLDEERAAR